MNYHDQKICRTPTHDIREHWTSVSTLLGLISSIYRDLHHWRSNERPQIAVPNLYNWATSSYRTQVTLSQQVMVIVMCLASFIRTLSRGHGHPHGHGNSIHKIKWNVKMTTISTFDWSLRNARKKLWRIGNPRNLKHLKKNRIIENKYSATHWSSG